MLLNRGITLLLAHCLLLFLASTLAAQPQILCTPSPVKGRVVDPAENPIEGAKVIVRNIPLLR